MTNLRDLLGQLLTDATQRPIPVLTRRDIRLPVVAGKAIAVVGVRRAGKTSFLWQILGERLAEGKPRESMLLLGLEDDRLADVTASDLDWLVEEYFRRHPAVREQGPLTLCLDEVQNVPGWERFARRLIDTESVELLLSGSSAKLLSREVATSLRGRGMEVLVQPFSFREALRHAGSEPLKPASELSRNERSAIEHRLRQYLRTGGFPEAQGIDDRDRVQLLRGYVDVVALRDVIERHGVTNPVALRWLQRQLLSTPAGSFSVQKLYQVLKSQGIPIGKDTLHEYLSYLEDTFLIRTVSLHTASERQRMVNPRKVYPVDPGLISVYERTGRSQLGHALETVIVVELERRGYQVDYVRTEEGWEVDFLATASGAKPLLLQVCAETTDPATVEREVRALMSASLVHGEAAAILITADSQPPAVGLPKGMRWTPASHWLLSDERA